MTQIEDLGERLKKIFHMLGSENDGEVSNAARLITRILRESKLDWHDVTRRLFDESRYSGSKIYNYSSYGDWVKREEYKKRQREEQEEKEEEDGVFWDENKNGNFKGYVFGRNCTVFKSKFNPGLWDGVINEFGGKKIWIRGYNTARLAMDAIEFKLDPKAKDDW